MPKQRLDIALVERNLARSRTIAAQLIAAGKVAINNKVATKASQLVDDITEIVVTAEPIAASRAAHKLSGALAALNEAGILPEIRSSKALDIGASTGGFTEVLLKNGAAKVIALDVGHNQLIPELRADERVITIEGVNARYLTSDQLPYAPDIITADLSFISLTFIFPVLPKIAQPNAAAILLIKPQFEVGKEQLGKGGLVRDPNLIAQTLIKVLEKAVANGLEPIAVIPSPITGENGNREFFLYAKISPGAPFNSEVLSNAAQAAVGWASTDSTQPTNPPVIALLAPTG